MDSVARKEYPIVNAELFANSLTNLEEVSKALHHGWVAYLVYCPILAVLVL